jgi:hypothetical protein
VREVKAKWLLGIGHGLLLHRDRCTPGPKSSDATMGIDIGRNSFHVVELDRHGAIDLRQKWSRSHVEVRLASLPHCLSGIVSIEPTGRTGGGANGPGPQSSNSLVRSAAGRSRS